MAKMTSDYRAWCRQLVAQSLDSGHKTLGALATATGLSRYMVKNAVTELGRDAELQRVRRQSRLLNASTGSLSDQQLRLLFDGLDEPYGILPLRVRAREMFGLELLDSYVRRLITRVQLNQVRGKGGRRPFLEQDQLRTLFTECRTELLEGSLTPKLVRLRAKRLFNKRDMSEATALKYTRLLEAMWKAEQP